MRKQFGQTRRRRPQNGTPDVVGQMSYGSPLIKRYEGDRARVVIGSFVSIAEDVVLIVGGNHRTDWVSTFPFRERLKLADAYRRHPASKGDIVIGSDVWIGRGATVLSGVHIADGAVVGANAVVTRDVRPYAIVVGNPAREVRRRFDDATVDALLEIAWWTWPVSKILEHVDELNGEDVDAFVVRHEQHADAINK